ncbi:MAG: MFS transporter, partial [Mycobacteriales bacterium]
MTDVDVRVARAAERRGLLVAFGVFGAFWGSWSASLPALRHQVGATDGRLGLALAALALSAVPVMPVAGRLVDRFGAR